VTDTTPAELTLPAALAEAFALGFEWEYDDETDTARGYDFEPYEAFEAPERTAWWFRLWTGNAEVTGGEFRFFGATGAGDYAGFWLVRRGVPVVGQPVVFLGSEGERGVVAGDLGGLLWLFAAGLGPAEAFGRTGHVAQPSAAFLSFAQRYAPDGERSPARIVAAAQAGFPDFSAYIDGLCR
jgi:hypothetical protein